MAGATMPRKKKNARTKLSQRQKQPTGLKTWVLVIACRDPLCSLCHGRSTARPL
jgi:hypothetical protein